MIMYIPSRKMQEIATRDLDRGGRGGFCDRRATRDRTAPLWVAEGPEKAGSLRRASDGDRDK